MRVFRYGSWAFLLLCFPLVLLAKGKDPLAAGPFQGHSSDQEIHVWAMFYKARQVKARLVHPQHSSDPVEIDLTGEYSWKGLCPVTLPFRNLLPATRYKLELEVDGKPLKGNWLLSTTDPSFKDSWSFLLGSCSYSGHGLTELVETKARTRIFEPMAAEQADQMLWLGDNIYYLGGEWNKDKRMMKRNVAFRLDDKLRAFMQTCPQYSIWDDHDFGPNDSDGSFENKENTLAMFQRFWANPAYGTKETPGVFYHFAYKDAEFFMLDDRYHRIEDGHKQMLGPEQMAWLQEKLKASTATFKFVAMGGQVLNEKNTHECWNHFPEKNDFIDFLKAEKVEGVLFLSGDRHFSELLKLKSEGMYPLYDFTCSPLSSWIRKSIDKGDEAVNPLRVDGSLIIDYNYGKINISGPAENRLLKIEIKGIDGNLRFEHKIRAADLRF